MANHRAEPCRRTADRTPARRLRRAGLPAALSSVIVAGVATAGGVAVVRPESVASTMYELSALIIEGSSTNPTGEGIEDFYRGKFVPEGGEVVQVNFFTGPFGVYDALKNRTDEDNVVMSSGWGAANVSLLLTYLDATGGDDPVAANAVYVLDNNVARPNGGFGTRYPVFALIGVNPLPTPTSPGATVIDVGYEYDINGNAPAYVLNPFAMANSLAAYFDNRLNQETVNLPVDENGDLVLSQKECDDDCRASIADGDDTTVVLETGETVVIKQVGDTTYISYRRDGLPLLHPLRTYGGEAGNKVADAIEDPLTDVVNYGYPGNDPLANPDVYQPAALVPTPDETATFLRNLADPDNNASPAAESEEEEELVLSTLAYDDSKTSHRERTTTRAASERDERAKKPAKRFADRINDVAKKVTDGGSEGPEKKRRGEHHPRTHNESTDD